MFHIPSEGLNLAFDLVIFLQFSLEKLDGDSRFFLHAMGREQVGVGEFGVGVFEAFDLDETLPGQLRDTIVHLADTNPHHPGHVLLGDPRFIG